MKPKKVFWSELAYVVGILSLAAGTALMERADFGVSMVVAPAYLVYLKLSSSVPFFTFGMAEYAMQALLILALAIVMRKFKRSYLFSFVTAVLYGLTLDGCMRLVAFIPGNFIALRLAFYVSGLLLCALGVSMLFHTYIAPEAYELFVKELAHKLNMRDSRLKTIYDCVSCAISVVLSFAFFGLWRFEGVKLGTVFCALVNGFIIGRLSDFFEARFEFQDALPLKRYFDI